MYCMYFFNSVSVIDLSWVHWNKGQKNDSTVLWDTQEFVIVSGDVIILFPFFIKFKHNYFCRNVCKYNVNILMFNFVVLRWLNCLSSCSFFCLFFFLVVLLKFLSPSARQKIQSKKDERHQTWKPLPSIKNIR